MINNGAHYTSDSISKILIQALPLIEPTYVLDLGIGDGALSKQFQNVYKTSNVIGIDINLQNKLKNILINDSKLYQIDLRKENIFQSLQITKLDAAISNPPYIKLKFDSNYKKLLSEIKILNYLNLNNFNTEILFAAYGLSSIKKNGILGIIVSDSISASHTYKGFREAILKNYKLIKIIDIPERSFKTTEAKTTILIIKKIEPVKNYMVTLCKFDPKAKVKNLKIQSNLLHETFDFKYWHFQNNQNKKLVSLNDLGAEIRRGSFSHKELKSLKSKFVHTTSLDYGLTNINGDRRKAEIRQEAYANKGNILLGRVGRNCYRKIGYIRKGKILISDCVYKIEINKEYQQQVLDSLQLKSNIEILSSICRGVCAKSISKQRLMKIKFIQLENASA